MANENKKRTQREVLEEILANAELTAEQREVLEKIVANIKKKNAQKTATKSKEHTELEERIEKIISAEPNRIFTCAEVAKVLGEGLTTQKITPRLASLVESGKLVKTVEKRVNNYKWAE